MAEVLIIRRKAAKLDAEQEAAAYKPGDVVVVKPDGWAWTQRELTNPDWRIARFTRCSVEDLGLLLRPEMDLTGLTSRMMRRRMAYVDDLKLPAGVRAWWNDDTRATPILVSSVSRATVLSYITTKVPRVTAQTVLK